MNLIATQSTFALWVTFYGGCQSVITNWCWGRTPPTQRDCVQRGPRLPGSWSDTGRDKTLERVLRRFWWKNASDVVGAWVASCPTCQAVKPRSSYPDGLLNPHAIPSRNRQDVGMDFVTELPLTEQGNDAFVAFICKLSKMVHVVPMNFGDSSAANVARIYFDTVCVETAWGAYAYCIISDRDPRFQDAFWKELMRLMGVKVAMTTPYNPRSDAWTSGAH
eukprot:gene18633-biopygen19223